MTIINFFIQDWQEFAKKHNGTLKSTKTGFSPVGFGMSVWKRIYLNIPYHRSDIVFFTGEAAQMKIYYNFKKDIRLNFLIYPEDYFDKIGKCLNLLNDITIHKTDFDNSFFIKSNNDIFIRKILSHEVMDFLLKNKIFLANVKLENEKNTTVLELNAPFDERNLTHMEDVLSFFKKTIDNIEEYIKNQTNRVDCPAS